MSDTRTYTVILEPAEEGGFVVHVPALPEVVTEGETEAEALAMAKEAIELALEERVAEGENIPDRTRSSDAASDGQAGRTVGRMNGRLGDVSGREVVRALQRAGFVVKRIRGSHHILIHSSDRSRRATVPVHGGTGLKRGTLRSILKQARLTEDELRALL